MTASAYAMGGRSAATRLIFSMAVLLASSCTGGSSAEVAAQGTGGPIISAVSFGATPDTLLLTSCEADSCTITLIDEARKQSTEYVAPSGGSIEDARMEADVVMAVVTQAKRDARGNRRSAIVTFPSGGDTMTVRHRAPVMMRYPVDDGRRLMFWMRNCRSLTDRYCQHDLFAATGTSGAVRIGRSYRFAEVNRIVPREGSIVVNAGFPADGIFDGRYLDYAGSNGAWRLASDEPFGLARLADRRDVIRAMPLTGGDLLLLADDEQGTALFRRTAKGIERVAGLPPATDAMRALAIQDVDVSHDGKWAAMIVVDRDAARTTTLFMLDLAEGTWRTIDLAGVAAQPRIVLKETPDAR